MSNLTSPVSGAVVDFDPFTVRTEADPSHQLGSQIELVDTRKFRYGKVGASNVSKGKLQLAPAPKANHHNVAVAVAAASGATQVTVTLGATAAVAGEYDEGFLAINDVDGEGQVYKIGNNPAANASATLAVKLLDGIATALTTSSEATLVHNAHNGVVEAASQTRRGAGVPLVSVSAGDFGWFQVSGPAAVLADGALALGAICAASGAVAGAVVANADVTAPIAETFVGVANILAGVDTEYRPISLTIN